MIIAIIIIVNIMISVNIIIIVNIMIINNINKNLLSCALNALQDFCQFLRLCLLAFLSKEEWEEFADWSKRRPPLYSATT